MVDKPGAPALGPRRKGPLELWAEAAPVIGERQQVTYRELPCRSVVNRCANPRMPFGWTINPYRGCEFGCVYCYARYTHEYLGLERWEDFENRIYVKTDAARRLEEESRAGRLRGRSIAIGTATDPYQPAERRYGVTRALLEVFSRGEGVRLSITTKSDLITRDLDLLKRIAHGNRLHVNLSITTLWPALARRLEPRAPTPIKRLLALRELSGAGIECGVFLMPILPGLTDDDANLASVAEAAARYGARYLAGQTLFLRASSRAAFMPFLEREHPALARAYRRVYAAGGGPGPGYRARLAGKLAFLRERFALRRAPLEGWPPAAGSQPPLPW
jgi:DNA repair photolyase